MRAWVVESNGGNNTGSNIERGKYPLHVRIGAKQSHTSAWLRNPLENIVTKRN
jgi:hypothetical protein